MFINEHVQFDKYLRPCERIAVQITLELYGPLKHLGPKLTLDVAEPATAAQVKEALIAHLGVSDPRLIRLSALGDDARILREDERVTAGSYALLPPVAGG